MFQFYFETFIHQIDRETFFRLIPFLVFFFCFQQLLNKETQTICIERPLSALKQFSDEVGQFFR